MTNRQILWALYYCTAGTGFTRVGYRVLMESFGLTWLERSLIILALLYITLTLLVDLLKLFTPKRKHTEEQ